MTETLYGLEAETEDGRVYLLRNHRKYRQMSWHHDALPFSFLSRNIMRVIVRELLSHNDNDPEQDPQTASVHQRVYVALSSDLLTVNLVSSPMILSGGRTCVAAPSLIASPGIP